MKTLFLIALGVAGLSSSAFAQTLDLEWIDPISDTPDLTVNAGTAFTLDVEVSNPSVPSASIDTYDLTFETATGSSAAIASSVNSVTNLITNPSGADFIVTQGSSNEVSAYAPSTSNDLTLTSTLQPILAVNFTGLAAGTYTVEFPVRGGLQNLYNSSGTAYSYNEVDATITVQGVPEPSTATLLLAALSLIVGFRFLKGRLLPR
jgi:hypothetical protein